MPKVPRSIRQAVVDPVLRDLQQSIVQSQSFHAMLHEKTPQEVMREIERRKAEAVARKAEHDKRLLHAALSKDAQFSLTYVPFVIAEVAWDYVECMFDLLKMARRTETKKLCRAIKEIHRDYDRERFKTIDDAMRKNELENMENFVTDKEMSHFFGDCYRQLRASIARQYGEVEENSQWIVSTAYIIHIVLQALFRFMSAQEKCVEAILGYKIEVLPKELHTLDKLILEFAGDMLLNSDEDKTMMQHSVNELAEAISSITANITD